MKKQLLHRWARGHDAHLAPPCLMSVRGYNLKRIIIWLSY